MSDDRDEIDPITAEHARQQGKKWFVAFAVVLAVMLAAIFGWVFVADAATLGLAPHPTGEM